MIGRIWKGNITRRLALPLQFSSLSEWSQQICKKVYLYLSLSVSYFLLSFSFFLSTMYVNGVLQQAGGENGQADRRGSWKLGGRHQPVAAADSHQVQQSGGAGGAGEQPEPGGTAAPPAAHPRCRLLYWIVCFPTVVPGVSEELEGKVAAAEERLAARAARLERVREEGESALRRDIELRLEDFRMADRTTSSRLAVTEARLDMLGGANTFHFCLHSAEYILNVWIVQSNWPWSNNSRACRHRRAPPPPPAPPRRPRHSRWPGTRHR